MPLTERGRAQAVALASAVSGRAFSLVLTSPLVRAVDSCSLAGLAGVVEPDLREWDYGSYEGRTTAEIREEVPGWTVWSGPVPGGETMDAVAARADRVIARVDAVEGDVALVAHGHLLRVLAARWLGLAPDAGRLFALDTASLSRLGTERETKVIRTWNHPAD